uniref:Uncharacterized protein n=1 Tax=Oryza meridionalis TaxID=40149 RepID=A0A0E0DYA5_9ORYZ
MGGVRQRCGVACFTASLGVVAKYPLTDSNEWGLIVSFGAFIGVMHHRLPGFRMNAEILKSKHVVFAG